jgi:hypothetical protein
MKYLKEYNNWITDVTDKNVVVNYGDKKPKLSDVVIDTIKFIEDNFDNINPGINSTNESSVGFKYGLNFSKIYIGCETRDNGYKIPYICFNYHDANNANSNYSIDITEDDYEYLKKYFYKIYRIFRKKEQEKDEEEYKKELQKIENKKIKKDINKYNL